jgi:hypothetical protein
MESIGINGYSFNLFKGTYFKVHENNRYYFAEDQFDMAKNNAVLKLYQLLELSTNYAPTVLDFNIKALSGYKGFGSGALKYPAGLTEIRIFGSRDGRNYTGLIKYNVK